MAKEKHKKKKINEKAKKNKSNLVKLNLIGKKYAPYAKQQCSLKTDIIHEFQEHLIPLAGFSAVTNLDGLVKLLINEKHLCAQKND